MERTTEFRMLTDLQSELPQKVAFNYEEIKGFLSEVLGQYKGLVVTEEQIPEAKAIRAKINKLGKVISDQRISMKKMYLSPFEEFETRCKELTLMCESASREIGEQIDYFDGEKKQAKINALRDFYEASVPEELADYCAWERVLNPRWGNVTFSAEEAKQDILSYIAMVKANVEAVKAMNTEFESVLLYDLQNGAGLAECMKKVSALKDAKAKAEAQRAKEEEAKAQREKADRDAEVLREMFDDDGTVYELAFKVYVTKTQMRELKAFLKEKGIKTERA